MATRPIFIPELRGNPEVSTQKVTFSWSAGLSKAQKQKNIDALHTAAAAQIAPAAKILEISSKSRQALGVELSAFNLGAISARAGGFVCVESLYQASKVFAEAGPFPELYVRAAKEVRAEMRAYKDQALAGFELHGTRWPLVPQRAFYDWLYCQALHRNARLAAEVAEFGAFSDIEFNPSTSINCQAYAAALYVSLLRSGSLEAALSGQTEFIALHPSDGMLKLEGRQPAKNGSRTRGQTPRAAAADEQQSEDTGIRAPTNERKKQKKAKG